MMLFSILFILLITFGIGLQLILLISPKMDTIQKTGISFPLGIGIYTLAMYLTNLMGLKFDLMNTILLFILFSAPLVIINRKKLKEYKSDLFRSFKNQQFSTMEKVSICLMGFLVISGIVSNFYWPVHTWDALTLYDFRARVFIQTGFIKNILIDSYYLEYPLLTSLAHLVMYQTGADNPKFIYSLFYISLGLSFYGLVRENLSRRFSLVFTLILLSVPIMFEHSLNSYTNLPYTIYFTLGAIYFFLWDKKRISGYLILSAILIALSTWTRSIEPFWLGILLVVVLTSIYRKRFLDILIYSVFFFPIQQAWRMYQSTFGPRLSTGGEVVSYFQPLSNLLNFNQWKIVIAFIYQYIIGPWGEIFAAFLLSTVFLVLIKKWKEYFLIFFTTYLLLAMLFVGTFIDSYLQTSGCFLGCGDAATRLSMLLIPLFIFCTALAVTGLNKP